MAEVGSLLLPDPSGFPGWLKTELAPPIHSTLSYVLQHPDVSLGLEGGASGIGRSIALTLAKAGCDVVVADIDLAGAEHVASEIGTLGCRGVAMKVDVSKLADVRAMAEKAYMEFGNITILVNNAGVTMRPFRALWDTSKETLSGCLE
ncbi:hypothetical protein BJX63DRAFT_437917 [Aspergillus granulosus]|uniref:Uncharacterized protein n=1 Tax=Aspergillus granulosus TaxID=176169 RepID=A0ABR4GTJ6_9EURO